LQDNFQTLNKSDVKQAIQKLSDALSLPMEQAKVFRIDVADNFVMQNDFKAYLQHLGTLNHYSRFEQARGLYYSNSNKQIIFYDKVAETKAKGLDVPEMYLNRNILRYELRFKKRLTKTFSKNEIVASDLHQEQFFNNIVKTWFNTYKQINKVNDIKLNYDMVKTVKEFQKQATLHYILERGGELKTLDEINQAKLLGQLTRKQAFDLKQQIKTLCKDKLLTGQSSLINELDAKIKQSYNFYN
jgi:hypothetical protein